MADIEMYIMVFGGMIVAASTLEAAYRPGSFHRLLFGLSAIAMLCLWVFVIFGGGVAEVSYGPYFVRFDITKIVYIIMFGISLKALLVIQTYSVSRKAEEQRAREQRASLAKKRIELAQVQSKTRPRPKPVHAEAVKSFSDFSKAEYEVTADDLVGYSPLKVSTPLPEGMKECEICGTRAPVKDYVCKNCGAWFPSDTIR